MPAKKPVKKTSAKKPTAAKKTTVKKTAAKKPVAKKISTPNTSKKISNFEKKLDKIMTKLQKKLTFVTKFMELDFIKSILSSKIIEDTNNWVKENLETISKIIGRVIVVFGAIGVLTTLGTMGVLIAYFGGGFIILLLLNLVYILIGMLLGFGLIKMKKRVPFFITLVVLVDLAYFILAGIFSGFGSIPSPRTIIFYIIFLIYVLKNKTLFNK